MSGYSSRASSMTPDMASARGSQSNSRASTRMSDANGRYDDHMSDAGGKPGRPQYLRNGTKIPEGLLQITEEAAATREARLLNKIKGLRLENESLHRDIAALKEQQFKLQDTKNEVVAKEIEIRKLQGDLRGYTRMTKNQGRELERLQSQDETLKEVRALKEEVRVLRAQARAHQERHRKNDELIKAQHTKIVTVNEKCRRLVDFIQENGIEDPTRSRAAGRAASGDSERMRRLEKQVESANRGRDVAERKLRALQNEFDKTTASYEARLAEKDKELKMNAAEIRKRHAGNRNTVAPAVKRSSQGDESTGKPAGKGKGGNPRPPSGPKKGPAAASPKKQRSASQSAKSGGEDGDEGAEGGKEKEKTAQELLLEKVQANQEKTRRAQSQLQEIIKTQLPAARAALEASDYDKIKEQIEGTAALQVQLLYDRVLILLGRDLAQVTITDKDPKTGLVVMPLRIAPSWSQTQALFAELGPEVLTRLAAIEPSDMQGETMGLLDAYDDKVEELNVAKADMAYTHSSGVCQVVVALLRYARTSIELEMLNGEAAMLDKQLSAMIQQAQSGLEDQKKKKEEEEAAAKKKEEEEAAAKKKEEEEAAAKKKEEEEPAAKKKEEEEAAAKNKEEEEAAAAKKKKEEEEAAAKNKEEEEAAAKKKEEEEAAAKNKEEEEAAAKKKEEEEAAAAKNKEEEEAAAKKKEEEEPAAKNKEEEEAAAKKKEEEEAAAAKKKEEEEAAAKKKEEEEAAAKKAEDKKEDAPEPSAIPAEKAKTPPWKKGGDDSDSDFESFY